MFKLYPSNTNWSLSHRKLMSVKNKELYDTEINKIIDSNKLEYVSSNDFMDFDSYNHIVLLNKDKPNILEDDYNTTKQTIDFPLKYVDEFYLKSKEDLKNKIINPLSKSKINRKKKKKRKFYFIEEEEPWESNYCDTVVFIK